MASAIRVLRLSLAAAFLIPVGAHAQGLALNLKASTAGIAGGATIGLTDGLNVRVEVPYLRYTMNGTAPVEDMDLVYTADADLLLVAAVLDYHPFGGPLRLSAGAAYNRMRISFRGEPASGYTVGEVTFEPEAIGSLSGDVRLGAAIAPYAGIGVGNVLGRPGRLGLTLDLGVLFTGAPTVDLHGTGMIAPTAAEAPALEANLGWMYAYPMLAIGISYKLF